jgi:hypothetical protein
VFLKNKKETMYFFKIIKKILVLPTLLYYQNSRKFKGLMFLKKYKGEKKETLICFFVKIKKRFSSSSSPLALMLQKSREPDVPKK